LFVYFVSLTNYFSIEIKLVRAEGLKAADKGGRFFFYYPLFYYLLLSLICNIFIGTSDPYVCVNLPFDFVYKSPVVKKNCNPTVCFFIYLFIFSFIISHARFLIFLIYFSKNLHFLKWNYTFSKRLIFTHENPNETPIEISVFDKSITFSLWPLSPISTISPPLTPLSLFRPLSPLSPLFHHTNPSSDAFSKDVFLGEVRSFRLYSYLVGIWYFLLIPFLHLLL